MGSISDCCISEQKIRLENEGCHNMDTASKDASLPIDSKTNNPSIYSRQPDIENTVECTQSFDDDTRRLMDDSFIHEPSSIEPQSEPNDTSTISLSDPLSVTTVDLQAASEDTAGVNNMYKHTKIKRKKPQAANLFKIVVTEPLSPAYKLQGRHKSFWSDDHPYSLHKQRQKLLSDGYIRRYNITDTCLAYAVTGLIFDFYYFHYADYHSQLSILNDKQKEQQSNALVIADTKKEENLAQFLSNILNSKLAEKMWNKFDSSLKGQIETDKFAQFLILPVILYKSTLLHRKSKNPRHKKPHFDKKAIKHQVEHLAVWIMREYGEKQVDKSYHFVLTKKLYKTELARFILEYIQTYCEFD